MDTESLQMSEVIEINLNRLQQADEVTRADCTGVYIEALNLSDQLEETIIAPMSAEELGGRGLSKVGQALLGLEGKDFVTFGVDVEEYLIFTRGFLINRFVPHREYLSERFGSVELPQIIEVVFAHEIGHVDLIQRIREGIGVENAGVSYREQSKKELRALPLSIPSTVAYEWWINNKGGYRSAMQTAGYDEETFAQKLYENAEAYNYLTSEAYADNFSLQILRNMRRQPLV